MVAVKEGRDPQLHHGVSEAEELRLKEDCALGSEVRDHSRHVKSLARLAQVEQRLHTLSQDEEGWESQRGRDVQVNRHQLGGRHRGALYGEK